MCFVIFEKKLTSPTRGLWLIPMDFRPLDFPPSQNQKND
jgi:hypothetical protein